MPFFLLFVLLSTSRVFCVHKSILRREDRNPLTSRIWENILSSEVEHLASVNDPWNLLKTADIPEEYYSRLIEYAGGNCPSRSLQNLHSFISDLQSGLLENKSLEKAHACRQEGNRYFKLKEYKTASRYYRQGLLVVVQDSREATLLHGNLSAALFHESKWVACIWHICLALRRCVDLESSTKKRLKDRLKQACGMLELKNSMDFNDCYNWVVEIGVTPTSSSEPEKSLLAINIPEPKYGRDEKLRAFSSRLGVRRSLKQGRYIVSEGYFNAGDVLASEPAGGWQFTDDSRSALSVDELAMASCILLPFQRHILCFACHNPLDSVGYVCPHCNEAAFCGPPSICFAKHFTNGNYMVPQWHKDECRFIFLLNAIGLGHLCYRLATLRERYFLRTNGEASLDTLTDNFRHFHSHFEYGLTGWLCGLLMERVGLPNCGRWCFHLLHRLQCNAHAITHIKIGVGEDETLVGFEQERIGGGLFPAVSLINHACEPNIAYQFMSGFIVVRCIKDLKPGDEVSACYGPHFRHHPVVSSRKKVLAEQYFFECRCSHCDESLEATALSARESDQWKQLVDQIRSECTPLSSLTSLFVRLKNLINPTWTLPPEPAYGDLADETAHILLKNVKTKYSSEAQKIALYLTTESVNFVRDLYGESSTEYAWELVKLISVARAIGERDNGEMKATVKRILAIHYGEVEMERILGVTELRDIFD